MTPPRISFHAADAAGSGTAEAAVERDAIDERYKWKLEKIFPDWEAWERAFAGIEAALPGLAERQGTLADGADSLLATIEAIHGVQRRLQVVHVHASMRSDEDTRRGDTTARKGRASSLAVRFAEAVAWFEPELLELEPATIARYLEQSEPLRLYAHYLDEIQRLRPHTLDAPREELLAAAGNITRSAGQVFSALTNADLRFPTIEDERGRPVELTQARFARFLRSADRRVRRDAFRGTLDTFGAVRNTLAANLDANVRNHVFRAEARRYASCLEASLHGDAVPVAVYHTLIEQVRAHLPLIHRVTALKKRVLAVDPLEEHDLYVPLFTAGEFRFGYDEAQAVVREALTPLGDSYGEILERAFTGGWIDVHENVGKRSGAYSSGVYDTDPYILLNWSDQLGDTFTLVHELGHSAHSWLAAHHQPYVYGDYPIFTAEVASTFNELLLLEHLLQVTTDRDRRLYLLDHHVSQIVSTVVRQTMFAEFELRIHTLGEQRETLTADGLGEVYVELLRDYWGPEAQLDPARSPLTWARIPHFYYDFYVYQYATAYAAAAALSRAVLADGEPARERYLDILRSGCSLYPVETLQRGGVDMTGTRPFTDLFALLGSRLDEIDRVLAEGA